MRRVLLCVALAAGCAGTPKAVVDTSANEAFGIIRIPGGGTEYVIDPRSESCFLLSGLGGFMALAPVSCAALKRNVPEAARFIRWDVGAAATTPGPSR